MIGDLQETFDKSQVTAQRLGFSLADRGDFQSRFERSDGWSIRLSSDPPSYPAFTLSVVRIEQPERWYALWLLMEVMRPRIPSERARPSLDNQLWFLEKFADDIFGGEASYSDSYAKLNLSDAVRTDG